MCNGMINPVTKRCGLCGKDKSAHQTKHGGRRAQIAAPVEDATVEEFGTRMYREEVSPNRNYVNFRDERR